MADRSAIEWTEATWNPLRGCQKVSPGCKHCYAEAFAERWRGVPGHPYEQGFDLRFVPELLDQPLRWQRGRRIFVNSMSDLFQEKVPLEFIDEVLARMLLAPRHTFQVLTKRAEAMRAYFAGDGLYNRIIDVADRIRVTRPDLVKVWISDPANGAFRPWVWLGVSVEDRKYGLPRIDQLRETPAACRFLSVEPLLEDLGELDLRGIHWVIVGGESGRGARAFQVEWARSLRDQCRAAGVPIFIKQLGGHVLDRNDAGYDGMAEDEWPVDTKTEDHTRSQGELVRIRLQHSKGADKGEWPEDLRIQDFPVVRNLAAVRGEEVADG